jgi:GH35 family endo-1,4-beta-xylanase
LIAPRRLCTAADIITARFNQISPENVLKFQPTQPAADRNTFHAASDRARAG